MYFHLVHSAKPNGQVMVHVSFLIIFLSILLLSLYHHFSIPLFHVFPPSSFCKTKWASNGTCILSNNLSFNSSSITLSLYFLYFHLVHSAKPNGQVMVHVSFLIIFLSILLLSLYHHFSIPLFHVFPPSSFCKTI